MKTVLNTFIFIIILLGLNSSATIVGGSKYYARCYAVVLISGIWPYALWKLGPFRIIANLAALAPIQD